MLFDPAQPRPILRREMRAAGVYATLANIFGSWSACTIEMKAFGRGTLNKRNTVKQLSHTVSYYLRGGVPKRTTVNDICERLVKSFGREIALDASELLWHWWHHPLSAILCLPSDGHDHVIAQLKRLPEGSARALVWDEERSTISGDRLHKEVYDSDEVIEQLVEQGDYNALLALVGKMRLRQLQGRDDWDFKFERAIWRTLPHAVGTSPQLLLARKQVLWAVSSFMQWPPYADTRLVRGVCARWDPPSMNSINREIDVVAIKARLRGINLPPENLSPGLPSDPRSNIQRNRERADTVQNYK